MNRKIFCLVSVFVLTAMLLNLGYIQAQTPGQIPMFGQPLTGFCNSAGGNDCIDSVITQDPNGNVGIGTTAPDRELTIFNDGPTTEVFENFRNSNHELLLGVDAAAVVSAMTPTTDLHLRTNNANRMVITAGTGNVGIGTTAPGGKLDVVADTVSSAGNTANFAAPNIGPNASHIHFGTNGDWFIRSASSGGKVILQDTGGNVGIGTTTPVVNARLHVVGSGLNTAVFGTSTAGAGVFGTSTNGTGVAGSSTNSRGVEGFSINHIGVQGGTDNPNRPGVLAISAQGLDANLGLQVIGRFVASGTKNAVIPLQDGQHVLLTAEESTEVWFSDYGSVQLVNGLATVQIDREFLQTVNTTKDYHVFLTARGNPIGALYIDHETASSFEIRESSGTANIKVSYRIVAKRKDFADERMKRVTSSYVYGEPKSQSLAWARDPEGMKRMVHERQKHEGTDTEVASLP